MDAQEVIAAAEQAVVASVDQAVSQTGASTNGAQNGAGATDSKQSDGTQIKDSSSKAGRNSSTHEATKSSQSSAAIDLTNDDDDDDEEDYMGEGEAGEMSFVIDTAGDMDVDREIALEDEAKADNPETHVEAGLLLPTHVNVIPQAEQATYAAGDSSAEPPKAMDGDSANGDEDLDGDMGDFEQLDMDPSTANRYYGAEEKAERRAKEQCLACGELGHDRRHCPHQHCLACGAMDEHPTRFCPLSTSCFRCGGMGHQTRTCPKPRRGPRSEECERCGSYSHVKALCPTLWRVYTYSTLEDYERHRSKTFFKLSNGSSARDPRRDLEPDPEELSDSEDEFARAGEPEAPASQFDPATRWCYNCSGSGNHWGDDCPEPRVNPTRGTGEPSAFSEFVSGLGPFAKRLPGAPPLAGYQMPSSQFTFTVGSSATMHVAGDAVASSSGRNTNGASNSRRGGQSSRDNHGGGGLAIGRHFLSSRDSSQTSSPRPAASSSRSRGGEKNENLVSFDRTKAVACEGGYLTRKEKKRGKTPLPEHLFRQWVRDRHDFPEHADEIRSALEKRAELEEKGLSTKDVPTTKEIVDNGRGKKGKGGKESRSTDRESDRPSKKRRGDSADRPVIIDDDDGDSFRDDYSDSDSDSDDGGKRSRRSGRKNRKAKQDNRGKPPPTTGWGHNGDGGGEAKRGKFSNQRKGGNDKHRNGGGSNRPNGDSYRPNGEGSGGKKRGRRSGNGGGGRGKNNSGGGGGGEKVRGGGSKYRGGYF